MTDHLCSPKRPAKCNCSSTLNNQQIHPPPAPNSLKLKWLTCLALNASYSALETYLWNVQMHPSPLPHQLLSLPRPQPDCRATNKSTKKHRKRGEHKVRQGVQKPHPHYSKQLEHHLRHQCPTGSVNGDSAGFHCYCCHLISAHLWHCGTKFKSFP